MTLDNTVPPFMPKHKPSVATNDWQDGLLKIVGKIDMRIWTLLWYLCGNADQRGFTRMGAVQLTFVTGMSEQNVTKWLARMKEMEWFDLHITTDRIKFSSSRNDFTTRRVCLKKINPLVRQGRIIPKNVIYDGIHTKTKFALYSVLRSRLYQPMFDQQMWNWRKRIINQRKVDANKYRLMKRKKACRLKQASKTLNPTPH
ncbi:MAG: hypothetical protein J7K90_09760 [Desulfuromusa sp.]|nr:hypothetical protein [Desulfuromusa sp.]